MSPLLDHLLHFGVSPTEKLLRTVGVYLFLLLSLRIFGKRELGQLNQFDLVVLLLLSNTLQNAIIGDDVSLSGGLLGAFILLVANAGVVHWIHRHHWADRLPEGSPDVLIRRGRVLDHRLDRELISRAELAAAARRQGIESLDRAIGAGAAPDAPAAGAGSRLTGRGRLSVPSRSWPWSSCSSSPSRPASPCRA